MSRRRSAFTLVELLVVIAIIGILIALLLPAVQAARESARRITCQSHLSQLIIAVHNYEMGHGVYPSGTRAGRGPVPSWPKGEHQNWIIHTLPYMEQRNTHASVDFSTGVYDPANAPVRGITLRILTCPSDPRGGSAHSNFAGVHHDREAPIDATNNGVFYLNSRVGYDDISDGAAHTLFIGEKRVDPQDLGWMSGTRATLRNTGTPINGTVAGRLPVFPLNASQLPVFDDNAQALEFWLPNKGAPPADEADEKGGDGEGAGGLPPGRPVPSLLIVGGFSSWHPGVCNFAFGDGRVTGLSEGIDPQTFQQLGNRADGKLLDEAKY